MHNLNLTQFAAEVFVNAKEHGWHDTPRSDAAMRDLFHCELSEAVESDRKGEPAWYHRCPYSIGHCEDQPVHDSDQLHCEACTPQSRKPEGAYVELIDFVIRVLDYLGSIRFVFPQSMDTAQKLANWAADDFQSDKIPDVMALDLPGIVDVLHGEIVLSDLKDNVTYLTSAVGLVLAWIAKQGADPVKVMVEKHQYNKTRSYRHGGKVY